MLEVKRLEVLYGKIQVVWDVSLTVRKRDLVAVIGPNGAGKTTTLKAIAGILKPKAGAISFGEKPIAGLPPYAIASLGIALIPEGRELFPRMSVCENLLLGAHRIKEGKDVEDTLDWVYSLFPILKERRKQAAGSLSGGEQQMLAIGRALMSKPSLLMLDEPSTGLAPLYVAKAFQIIDQLVDEGVTVLLVEQNVYRALEMADRGYVMEGGRTVLEGEGPELLENPLVKTAYLGT